MLILSVILGAATKQVDYTAAFLHAPIDVAANWDDLRNEEKKRQGVYVCKQTGKVLALKRSLYGLRQSSRKFFQHLNNKPELTGFRPEL